MPSLKDMSEVYWKKTAETHTKGLVLTLKKSWCSHPKGWCSHQRSPGAHIKELVLTLQRRIQDLVCAPGL